MKQISETHSELCEICMTERFCEDNKELKEVICIELHRTCLAWL